ncbi:hypothetical protein WJX72_010763 [[Myrmecia] bisecta]|uniref:Uncharacterized protein n=1 Tax=[Myrmecia] bisecta TaxID=41462 RepID=A0AAW1PUL1_9CHLO
MADALIVRKEGEGFGRPQGDNALPLDINYSKIADWLVDRKQLPSDWRKRLQVIAGKMAEASLSLPAELQADLKGPEGAAVLDYYRVRHIRDKLAESAEKTIFGYYTGPAGTWDKLVTAYEKGHVYLGEAGQTLLRNVDYEIPYADKQAAKLQQQLADLERKQADHLKSASASAAEYKQECKQLGISGSNIGRELIQLLDELPATFASTLTALHSDRIGDAMQHYQEFTAYAHPSSQHSADRQRMPDSAAEPLLPTLAEALQRKAGQEDKFKRLAKEAESKHVEVQQSLMTEAPKAAALRKRTADIKLDVERVLSGLFQGRTVNIIGEINNLI